MFRFQYRCSQKMAQYEIYELPYDPYDENFRPQIGHVQIFSFADCNFLSF